VEALEAEVAALRAALGGRVAAPAAPSSAATQAAIQDLAARFARIQAEAEAAGAALERLAAAVNE
jgi:hypothetical protein